MRTAVLVVHGIGSQRALETVRGVIRGVWLDGGNPYDDGRRIWSHPEKSGVDIDLTVMTTNEVNRSRDDRSVDFHELYWAHLMSETKAVAVLLWLYELGRKGPNMRVGLNGLWWAAAIFLCLMNLSIAVLGLRAILLFSGAAPQSMLVAPFLLLFSSTLLGLYVALRWRAFRLSKALLVLLGFGIVIAAIYFAYFILVPGWAGPAKGPDTADLITLLVLPTLVAGIASYLLMGAQGLRAFWRALVISLFMAIILVSIQLFWYGWPETWQAESWHSVRDVVSLMGQFWPWALNSPWSAVLSFAVLSLYLIVNAAFLQPYLGDAARYFRASPANVAVRRAIRKEAVDTLDHLHTSGRYDRIVVVAHSLGGVVAYDMLRAYFSRICNDLPPVDELVPEFDEIDRAPWQPDRRATAVDRRSLRMLARTVIEKIAASARTLNAGLDRPRYASWLVTDFVTLGSALSHAFFLMCEGNTRSELEVNFARRVREREFPTCPPKRLDNDGLLGFWDPDARRREFHHGALFGLTRWTNIYFPISQIFWGDAIGGPLGPIFGRHVVDLPVSTRRAGGADFFTHTCYWDVEREPDRFQAPQIDALRTAVDLADCGDAIAVVDGAVDDEDGLRP
jgi:hypothetical protein